MSWVSIPNKMIEEVNLYLEDGCGRCSYYKTPQCKVHSWNRELVELRRIVLECGLNEEYKWSQPTYTYKNANVVILSALKDYASLAFFKGVLLSDPNKMLHAPGENSQSSRLFKFTDVKDIMANESVIKQYIFEAVEIEKAGLKVEFKKNPEPIPEELEEKFLEDPQLKDAFESLTPGRQRGYILHFSQPKQSATRVARIERYKQKILDGLGFHDR